MTDAGRTHGVSGGVRAAPVGSVVARTTGYAWYVAGMLAVAEVIAIMDRYVLAVVLNDVKRSLVLSDTELGILQGPSFVLLIVAASLPIGRLIDVGNRRLIIALSLGFWSIATMGCGLASSFHELMAARMAVGLGEAALTPAALSLIAAYFSKDRLSRGLSIFSMGIGLGRAAGFVGGASALAWFIARHGMTLPLLGRFEPWQAVFIVAGLLGIAVAVLFLVTVAEPPRVAAGDRATRLSDGLRHFWQHAAAYLALFIPYAMVNAINQQLGAWTLSFYVRDRGLSVETAGWLIGVTGLAAGPLGSLIGGWANDRLRLAGVRGAAPLLLAAIILITCVLLAVFVSVPWLGVAVVAYGFSYGTICAAGPVGFAGVQLLTPDRCRGVVSSLFVISYTLLGMGFGPLVVGILSDLHLQEGGKLGEALMLTALIFAAIGIPAALFGRGRFEGAAIANDAVA